MVGKRKGMVSLLKKEMDARGTRHDTLVFFHCIVHQQSLCAKSMKFTQVVLVVTDCINFINTFDSRRTIYSYFDFGLKNSSFRLPYQRHSSSADCARELFKGSNGSASLVDYTRKNFLVGGL